MINEIKSSESESLAYQDSKATAILRQNISGLNNEPRMTALNGKFLEYQIKFKSNHTLLRSSLNQIQDNTINYKTEIKKLEEFLLVINDHEKNYKLIKAKFDFIIKNLQETIEIEKIINQLSSNQQIINMSEYVNLYKRVKKIIVYFKDSKLQEKEDFVKNMNKMMYKGFKVYQDAFYVIVKRYDQLYQGGASDENEKFNLLNKIKNLSTCLQDEDINFDFTSNLIKERSMKIEIKIDDIKRNLNKHSSTDETYIKGKGYLNRILQETSKLFVKEQEYIYEILSECDDKLKMKVIKGIIENPLSKIMSNIKELVQKTTKGNDRQFDFFHCFDIINLWNENVCSLYKDTIGEYYPDGYNEMTELFKTISNYCIDYVASFYNEVNNISEKIENENVLTITNDTVNFLSTLVTFDTAYKLICKANENDLSPRNFISILISKLESKAVVLEKKYQPLRYILLLNNIFFISTKIQLKNFQPFFGNEYIDDVNAKIDHYIEEYLRVTWMKICDVTFNSKDDLVYEADGKNLKQTAKEMIKKRFAVFNEIMKINLKFQQHLQVIDRVIETRIIDANIQYLCERYQLFINKYSTAAFTKYRNKYIIYLTPSDVEQDLRLYFMPDNY